MFKARNEKELMDLLKVFAEESVVKAKKVLNENNDNAQESYLNSLKQDEKFYNVRLSEQEDENEEGEEDKTPKKDEEDKAPKKDEEDEEDKEVTVEKLGVSFDSVLKDINTLRAGRSTKDQEIKEELLKYYDRLDEDERQILHLFLRELSRILQGALTGDDAVDPSDAPYNFDIERNVSGDNEEKDEVESDDKETSSGEDSSPPIKVNESQDLHEIRNKIKNLMKRY